ncbi:glycosyltransferase [Sphingomonas sp. NSE70-1]|uniref:Glycosyltransferase n=1 Tax=Sphingomonas caseinilyticus TaxID=2908205 RepID=A0ABT0RR89_9SPHN|nr:glycosyltransferase [Sphingomonas caseinilyticus]MCL6697366.1 glycosyltransferase [Sphingomonas caseinilyticus]
MTETLAIAAGDGTDIGVAPPRRRLAGTDLVAHWRSAKSQAKPMKILYITYDGLTDFIGQSQVLPYLLGSAAAGARFTVVSFEKPDRQAIIGAEVERTCRDAGIDWRPKRFRSSPPYLAKFIDQLAMQRAASAAIGETRFDLLHCRSYPAAMAGLAIKRRHGTPLLFDMRGFWPDQRREGGRWSRRSPIGNWLYRRWKGHEARLVKQADHIIVLTHAAKREVESCAAYRGAPISVIPCCADFDIFEVADRSAALETRLRLGIGPEDPVLGYLGSIGTVYMIGRHLQLFEAIKRRDPRAKALFIGRNQAAEILSLAADMGVSLDEKDVIVVAGERSELPKWLGAVDVGTCFIIPRPSSKGVSPTKLAEYLASGIPVIANTCVGDVEEIVTKLDAGHLLSDFGAEDVGAAVDAFFKLRTVDRQALRRRAQPFDLDVAADAYQAIYRDLHTAVDVGLR